MPGKQPKAETSNEKIVRLLEAGDQGGLDLFHNLYCARILAVLRSKFHGPARQFVEDGYQEAVIVLGLHPERFAKKGPELLDRWLTVVAKNNILDMIRNQQSRIRAEEAAARRATERAAAKARAVAALADLPEAIEQIPSRSAQLVRMDLDANGHESGPAIAQALGTNENNAYQIRSTAYKQLRATLEDRT